MTSNGRAYPDDILDEPDDYALFPPSRPSAQPKTVAGQAKALQRGYSDPRGRGSRSGVTGGGLVHENRPSPTAVIRHSTITKHNHVMDRLFAVVVYLLSALANVGGVGGGFVVALPDDTHLFLWRMPNPSAWAAGGVSLVVLTYIEWRYSPMHSLRGLRGYRRFRQVVANLTWQYAAAVGFGTYLTITAFKAIIFPAMHDAAGLLGFVGGLQSVVAWILYSYAAFAVEAAPEDILVSED